jgi:hypothetical protein
MPILEWYNAARSRVVPRTHRDLALTSRRKELTEWPEIRKAISATVEADDDAIGAALARMRAAEVCPPGLSVAPEAPGLTSLEMNLIFAAVGAQRTFQFFVKHAGAPAVALALASPSLATEWNTVRRAYIITQKKEVLHGAHLRELVLQADPKDREACRLVAEPMWEAGDSAARLRLAIAFLEHGPWRAWALADVLDRAPPFANAHLVLPTDSATMRTLLARRKPTEDIEYTEIVASLGEEALPILFELAKTATKHLHLSHTVAMTVFVTEDVARHLAACISHPTTRDLIGTYFEKHRELAAAVLPAASQGASRNAALAKALMIKVCGPPVEAESTVAMDDPLVPRILCDAPWRSPPPPLPDLGLDLDAYAVSVVLSEKRKAEGLAWLAKMQRGLPEMTPEEAAAYVTAHKEDRYFWYLVDNGKCIPLEIILDFFCAGRWHNVDVHLPLLDRFGVRALPGLHKTQMVTQLADDVLLGLDDPHLAFPLAAAILDEGRARFPWFVAHPRAAALGLLASAHDPAKRRASEILLRRLAKAGHGDVILETARGDAEVRAFLDRDPRLDVSAVPKVTMVTVTRPRLLDGRALGDDAIERILEMLALGHIDEPYAGIEDIKRACDPRSLAEMAWDLAALADGGGRTARARDFPEWMRYALTHLADDGVIRRLTPALKHPTIYRVLEALAQRGVRSAAMELATAHERGEAPRVMERVARSFGQSLDELVETILPTTPLEAEGTTTLQYGSRLLRVGFDTTLAPILFSGDQRLASLPRTKKDDDPIVVRLARERWEELKEDVRTIAHLRGLALEDAMRNARAIPAAHFLTGWVNHPLGKHQARGMVWAVERDAKLVTFRVAEDGSFADVHDEAFLLGDGEHVRVPHPAELSRDVIDAWLRTLGDYGLMQPVTQLGRVPLAIEPDEMNARAIVRKVTPAIPYSVVGRVLQQQRARARKLTRCAGVAHFDVKTQWVNRKTMVEQVSLTFRDEANTQVTLPPSSIDAVELAESLFVLRLVVEA